MRRWMAATLVFTTAVGLTTLEPRRAAAQPGPVAETFKTPDGMELHGLFHATPQTPASAPVVVFLYPPGANQDMTKGEWGALAKELNKAGYHVFQFDWRGHGKSTNIADTKKFWGNQYLNGLNSNYNQYIKGGGPAAVPLKGRFTFKDLTNDKRYMPAYLNDLAGVRLYLDTKNDNKELNTSSIYVVGAGDAAALGMAWITTEWNRPAVMPTVNQLSVNATGYEFVPQTLRGEFPPEGGADFGGAVWLTATRPTSIPAPLMQYWVSPKPPRANQYAAPKMRENNPMLFLFAEKDAAGKASSAFYFNEVLVADPRLAKARMLEVPEQTRILDVKGGEKLEGLKLLGQNATLKTEETIVQYFAFIQKSRQKIPSKSRKYETPYYIDTRYFGLTP